MTSPHNSDSVSSPQRSELYAALDEVRLRDRPAFRRRLKKARSPHALQAIGSDIAQAQRRVQNVDKHIPELAFPENLPVTAFHDDLAQAISENQVVIIAGETGSGKTTQIPKICLELGLGRKGLIGHTQPRRLAARTVAERIADELGQDIGESVGYAIRFDDKVSETTAVKLMTDGILLSEMQRDRKLLAYDTLIIDEAHERSLNIDFLLGYIKRLLPQRPDLKVIITSATIDPERFADHFAAADGTPAPIIEVSGRTFPVEIRYRPLEVVEGDRVRDIEPIEGLLAALQELMAEGPGDILCFFPGERDIRDAMDAIEGKHWRGVEVTPLFGRLSNQEQHRVFSPHKGRRIVLATNIAETSLTVPGIRYVIDTGLARISRYSTRTKVQRLPIEPISQASAQQRSGRCGRVADGIAIRLYSEEDFQARPEFTDPEILRTNLASVILQMAALRLGDIREFPFIQPPEHRAIRDGIALLHEIRAITQEEREGQPVLTSIGKDIARIPVDPRMARMVVEGHLKGVLDAVIVIVAGLTIQDIRERPLEFQAQADQLHARFKDDSSDFISYLKLWDYIHEQRAQLSGNAFRKKLKAEYLHHMRSREWRDLVRQLRDVVSDLGWKETTKTDSARDRDLIHQSLLSGLLMHIGVREGQTREYHGTRNTRFMIFPGSSLSRKRPDFIMAAEIVETSQLWARDVAAVDPAWVEKLGGHLLKRTYSEPFWSRKRGAAMVHEKVLLFGVPLVADREVPYHRVDPEAARDMFIRNALIDGDWNFNHRFLQNNERKLDTAAEIEDKARRRGLVVDEDTLFDFYDSKLPDTSTNAASFNKWWKRKKQKNSHYLDFDPAQLRTDQAGEYTEEQFPDTWHSRRSDVVFELSYVFDPGSPRDGVTVHVPVPMLAGMETEQFTWLVPGMREELCVELIRTLPKVQRRTVVPAPDFARRALPHLDPTQGTIAEGLASSLHTLGVTGIGAEDFQPEKLPDHLKMTYAAIDKRGKVIDSDKNLKALQTRQTGHIRSSVSKLSRKQESIVAQEWTAKTFGALDETVTTKVDGHDVTAYPALVATEDGFSVKVLPTKRDADAAMITATLTMLLREVTVNTKQMVKGLPLTQRVAVDNYPHGGADGLVNDARVASVRDALVEAGGAVRTPEEFADLKKTIIPTIPARVRAMVVSIAPALADYERLAEELKQWDGEAIADMKRQMEFLLPPQALVVHGQTRLRHLGRYVKAMVLRLEDINRDPDRDADRQEVVNALEQQLEAKVKKLGPSAAKTTPVKDILWDLQELRVSLFAQRLGTAKTISPRRIEKAIAKL